ASMEKRAIRAGADVFLGDNPDEASVVRAVLQNLGERQTTAGATAEAAGGPPQHPTDEALGSADTITFTPPASPTAAQGPATEQITPPRPPGQNRTPGISAFLTKPPRITTSFKTTPIIP